MAIAISPITAISSGGGEANQPAISGTFTNTNGNITSASLVDILNIASGSGNLIALNLGGWAVNTRAVIAVDIDGAGLQTFGQFGVASDSLYGNCQIDFGILRFDTSLIIQARNVGAAILMQYDIRYFLD
tara:strand:- start:23 stop:412 length:390 start_codon:yes stop_codon:yes gene_type:complete